MLIQLKDLQAKRKELEFYNNKLKELHLKQVLIQQEIKLTKDIIERIETETIIEIR